VDLLDEIKAELDTIDKSIQADVELPKEIAKFSDEFEIHQYNPNRLSKWQSELDTYVPPEIILPDRLKLDNLNIPEQKLDIDVDKFHMGED
jgi:hypothetical protein